MTIIRQKDQNSATPCHPSNAKAWIEAMRLRTLPVSIAGVIAGLACSLHYGSWRTAPAVICLLFAILAQIVSNFANEYYDYANGLDKKGREGFRRGVTEGDISPSAMKHATYATLAVACALGLSLTIWGEWWLIAIGIAIAVFAISYSTGPYPLSHHGLGDIAVIIFFGIIPVTLTAYLQSSGWEAIKVSLPTGIAIGLLGANVLIVNNYRDREDDLAVGKRTTVVIFGRKAMQMVYILFGLMGVTIPYFVTIGHASFPLAPLVLVFMGLYLWLGISMGKKEGAELNVYLKRTSLLLLAYAVYLLLLFA